MLRARLREAAAAAPRARPPLLRRSMGDISDSFVSLSGAARAPLPDRFRQLKCGLVRGRERAIVAGWSRLLRALRRENQAIAAAGSAVIPQVDFADLDAGCERVRAEVEKRGALVVRGVIPEDEARAYKRDIDEYVGKNPHTIGRQFPPWRRRCVEASTR